MVYAHMALLLVGFNEMAILKQIGSSQKHESTARSFQVLVDWVSYGLKEVEKNRYKS
jgi:hypothetical protein